MKLNITNTNWFFNKTILPEPNVRLFCFPYACGGASIYRDWINQLSPNIEVIPIQLPGRENRIAEKAYTNMSKLINDLYEIILPLSNVPIAFFGHSMGGLISFELTQKMQKNNINPIHLFVSAHPAPNISSNKSSDYLLSNDELKNKLRNLSFTPEDVLQNTQLMNLLLPTIRADFALSETYQYQNRQKLNTPITVYGGTNDKVAKELTLNKWQNFTNNNFSFRLIEGDHFFIHNSKEILITDIYKTLIN